MVTFAHLARLSGLRRRGALANAPTKNLTAMVTPQLAAGDKGARGVSRRSPIWVARGTGAYSVGMHYLPNLCNLSETPGEANGCGGGFSPAIKIVQLHKTTSACESKSEGNVKMCR